MKITNKHNVPENIVLAMREIQGEYTKGDAHYSISGLLDSPRIQILRSRHFAMIEEDITEGFKAWIGSVMHKHLSEKDAKRSGLLSSGHMFVEINGFKIKGESDLYNEADHSISDYKFTSVYSIIYESRDDKFEEQLNGYAMLFRELGLEVKSLKIIYFLTDWSKRKASREPDYPQSPIVVKEFRLWTEQECKDFFQGKIYIHSSSKDLSDDELPECTDEEKWQSETSYAVMKEGNKKATKTFSKEEEANAFVEQKMQEALTDKKKAKDKYSVEIRPGEAIRCNMYCPVNQFCNVYLKNKPSV
ncbi:hypothetical protein [Leptospira phage LE3]|uniref:PD-(D/E)XK endonuclease-like domain-containing protein n=1 Tax=Leptospira phage LE3 TaxID=2041382 RepID=A0A343LEA2_9CAUD|nr:exonuclease [Leptospira phage LE3]ATN95012.1 hypothetical protein [Leptospira phage LE3]